MIFSLIYKISRFEWLGFFLNEFFGGNPKWYTKYLFFLQVFISYSQQFPTKQTNDAACIFCGTKHK